MVCNFSTSKACHFEPRKFYFVASKNSWFTQKHFRLLALKVLGFKISFNLSNVSSAFFWLENVPPYSTLNGKLSVWHPKPPKHGSIHFEVFSFYPWHPLLGRRHQDPCYFPHHLHHISKLKDLKGKRKCTKIFFLLKSAWNKWMISKHVMTYYLHAKCQVISDLKDKYVLCPLVEPTQSKCTAACGLPISSFCILYLVNFQNPPWKVIIFWVCWFYLERRLKSGWEGVKNHRFWNDIVYGRPLISYLGFMNKDSIN